MPSAAAHFEQVRNVESRTPQGCEACLKTGGQWVHLRLCLICGHVGSCDESPGKHATKHFHHTGHPVMQSMEQADGLGLVLCRRNHGRTCARPVLIAIFWREPMLYCSARRR